MGKKITPDSLIREDVLGLSAYAVPDASGFVKLDAMENPYRWPEELQQEWLEGLKAIEINRYPDPRGQALVDTIRSRFRLGDDVELLLGNGSDEIIQILVSAIAKPDAVVLSVEPGFVMYKYISLFAQVKYVGVDLDRDFNIDLETTLAAIKAHKPALIFLAYPNNPTGNLFARADIDAIIAAAPGLVVIDEAYTSFASDSYIDALAEHDKLLVLRTVSKMGLAGLRLGYLCGAAKWLHEFDKVRLPYNINVLTQYTAQFALDYKAVLDDQTNNIIRDREWLSEQLNGIGGLEVYPSQANFILFRTTNHDADTVFQKLLDQKVLIKNLSKAGPALKNCLRMTVGTKKECEQFLAALKQAM